MRLLDQFIFAGTQANLFRMFEARLPFTLRSGVFEMVVMVVEIRAVHVVVKLAARHWGSGQTSIHTSLVEGKRILGHEHTDVRKDRRIVFRMAIAIWRDVQHQ